MSASSHMCWKSQRVHTVYYTNNIISHRIVVGHLLIADKTPLHGENHQSLVSEKFFTWGSFVYSLQLMWIEIGNITRSIYKDWFDLIYCALSNITAISWRPALVVEEAGSTLKEPPTMGKQLVNVITCGCESNAPSVIYKVGRQPTPY